MQSDATSSHPTKTKCASHGPFCIVNVLIRGMRILQKLGKPNSATQTHKASDVSHHHHNSRECTQNLHTEVENTKKESRRKQQKIFSQGKKIKPEGSHFVLHRGISSGGIHKDEQH